MTKPSSPMPFSIKLIALGFVVSGISSILLVVNINPISFGHMSGANPATTFFVSFFEIVLALGLWKLFSPARWTAILYLYYRAIYDSLYFFSPERERMLSRIATYYDVPYRISAFIGHTEFAIELVVIVLAIWLLIKHKSAFVKPTTPSKVPA